MSVESTELKLYIDNDYQLYTSGRRKSIIDNLLRKKNAGTYSHTKAVKLWEYFAEDGAKKYAREYGGSWHQVFSKSDRREVAKGLADDFEAQWRAGEWKQRQRELMTKKQIAEEWKKSRSPETVIAERQRLQREKPLPDWRSKPERKRRKKRTSSTRKRRSRPCGMLGGSCTKAEVEKMFRTVVMPAVREHERGRVDRPLRRQAWNEFIDALEKDGTITSAQASKWVPPRWLKG